MMTKKKKKMKFMRNEVVKQKEVYKKVTCSDLDMIHEETMIT